MSASLTSQIVVATLARLLINTSRRLVYPFAPALSRGLGVPLIAITSLIAVNQATGILSPLFGPLSDRWGYRLMLLVGVSLAAIGMWVSGFLPFYGVVLVGLFLAGLGKSIFDPALQAYVGARVPYQRRGLAIGVVELAWSGASLVGIPVMGLLIDRLGWRSPFFVLGGLALLALLALALVIPSDGSRQPASATRPNFLEAWRQLWRRQAALGALGFGFFASLGSDNLLVVYGAWLEKSFALTVVAVGAATTVIGLAEMLGEMLTASIADRVGLKRAIVTGMLLSTASYILLPLVGYTLPLALSALFVVFITFEFAMVTSISLFTETVPEARATMMSSFQAMTGAGRVVGALVGGAVWLAAGLTATGIVSAVASGLALLCLLWGWSGQRVDEKVA